ncbi:RNA-binding protein 12B-A [Bombina bombina]|uniref:RNA-binding protein 12B-A n=1 Tax=Bombina bombina TaxID=8345 RepID=UPI00235AABAE|nr:RNA-binding protein 12B-A [Bombina bombina]
MAVVIRLQGLPNLAGSVDIRNFFSGLNIPDGGVHIIGGKLGEAFIIFATDEDARRAMSRTGGFIKKSHVQLFLSSMAELQGTLDMNRKGGRHFESGAADVSKLLAVIKKGIHQNKFDDRNLVDDFDRVRHNESTPKSNYYGREETSSFKEEDSVYLFLYGLPYSVSVDEIKNFFHGLAVIDVHLVKRPNGLFSGNGYVKFGSVQDANAGLQLNNEYIGHRFISIKKCTEEEWINAGGKVQQVRESVHKGRENPFKSPNDGFSKIRSHSRSPPRKLRARSRSPQNQQFYIHLKNLPYGVEKKEIKYFFGEPDMPETHIKFLLDKRNNRSREGFVMLQNERQYQKCLDLNKNMLSGRPIFILPISRKAVVELIESYERQTPPKRDNSQERNISAMNFRDSPVRKCIYVRNFPFDISKREVQAFFGAYSVSEEDIALLYDGKGLGLGEALITFPSEQKALLAESLNRQKYLGTEVLLTRISDEQKKEFGSSASRNSPTYRKAYMESSYGSSKHSLGFPDVVRPSSRDFGNPMDDFRAPFPNDFGEGFGVFNMRRQNVVDLNEAGPFANQNLSGRPRNVTKVQIKNMPYTSTVEEVLDFFYGYNVNPGSVRITLTKEGKATGRATVSFETYEEALAAVNELNERPIGERKIILSLIRKKIPKV